MVAKLTCGTLDEERRPPPKNGDTNSCRTTWEATFGTQHRIQSAARNKLVPACDWLQTRVSVSQGYVSFTMVFTGCSHQAEQGVDGSRQPDRPSGAFA
jgi:hypothetical protein